MGQSTFNVRQREVRAVHWLGNNFDEVCAFFERMDSRRAPGRDGSVLVIPTDIDANGGWTKVVAGDWIVNDYGHLDVIPHARFRTMFLTLQGEIPQQ